MLVRAVFGIIGTGARDRFSVTKSPSFVIQQYVGILLLVNVNIGNVNHLFISVRFDFTHSPAERCTVGREQHAGRKSDIADQNFCYNSEKEAVTGSGDVVGEIRSKEEEARNPFMEQENISNVIGFSFPTPDITPTPHVFSPNRNKGDTASPWKGIGNLIPAERTERVCEKGNYEGELHGDITGRQVIKVKESRESEGASESGLGCATHTPHATTERQFSRPQTSKLQVYSRKRCFKKKLELGCTAGPSSDTDMATDLIISSPRQQQRENKEKCGSVQEEITSNIDDMSAQIENEEAEFANIQKQEAEALWDVAKALGVTCGSLQRNYVDKIMEMEERDRKETERLGNRRNSP